MDGGGRPRRWAGLAPGLAGATLLAYTLAGPEALYLAGGVLAVAAGLYAASRLRGRAGVEEGEGCLVYRVRSGGDPGTLLRIIEERAKRARAAYMVASIFSASSAGSLVAICGALAAPEAEVFETIVSAVAEDARLEPAGSLPWESVDPLFEKFAPGEVIAGVVASGERRSPDGGIYLGYRIDTPLPEPVYLSEGDIAGHVGVYGSTGTGKSSTLRVLASRAAGKGWRVVVLDWAGEHGVLAGARRLDPFMASLPVFELLEDRNGAHLLVDVLASGLGLSDPQSHMLSRILSRPDPPESLEELADLVARWPEESGWDREVKRGLARRLSALEPVSEAFRGGRVDAAHPPPGVTVVSLSSIASVRARRAYALSYTALLYHRGARGRLPGRVLLVVDEAHNLFYGGSDVFDTVLSEARKYGLHVAYATQSPGLVPDRVMVNTNTKIVHALRSQRDKRVVSEAMALGDLASLLDKLGTGEAVLQSPSIPQPVLVKVDLGEPPGKVLY